MTGRMIILEDMEYSRNGLMPYHGQWNKFAGQRISLDEGKTWIVSGTVHVHEGDRLTFRVREIDYTEYSRRMSDALVPGRGLIVQGDFHVVG